MASRFRLRFIPLLGVVLFTVWVTDFALWRIDPRGVMRYFSDWRTLQAHATPVPDGYRYSPGIIPLIQSTVSIDADGLRSVPESRGGVCRIVFVGDSVTFGLSNPLSFVDLLAPDIDAQVINAGLPAYNLGNISALMKVIPADGYIWLVFTNDAQPDARWSVLTPLPPALVLYHDVDTAHEPESDYAAFETQIRPILARPDVLAFAFASGGVFEIVKKYGAIGIPFYTHRVSAYDGHPNNDGAKQIADSMRARVVTFTDTICRGKKAV